MLAPVCLAAGQHGFVTAAQGHVNRVPYRLITAARVDGPLLYLVYNGQVLAVPVRIFPGRAEAEGFAAFVQNRAKIERKVKP